VAPPVTWLPTDFTVPACPWLLVHGSADDVVPVAPVLEWCNALAVPPQLQLVDGVGHYFHGRLAVLETAVAAFFGRDFGAAGR
jgi:alpha/beta superfamily hydrolase